MTQTHSSAGLRSSSVTFPAGSVLLSESPGPGGGPLRLGLIGLTSVSQEQAAELADVLSTFATTGRLPAPDPQPPASAEFWQDVAAREQFGRRASYFAG